ESLTVTHDFDRKDSLVRRTLDRQGVVGRGDAFPLLDQLLEPTLIVGLLTKTDNLVRVFVEQRDEEGAGSWKAPIEIDRRNHCFKRTCQNSVANLAVIRRFATPKIEQVVEFKASGPVRQRFGAHQRRAIGGQ